ncbi:MraY family glycosyltransferase [Pseudonocardia sp. KRD291]|uniref:glycosyltransferase family 4 protein n=1 Tax=Pseudonocardia sp. KRD291 TaxID=2792007 RepID=UPI0027E331F0|nr:MraY family glycosyltransferase [Pseudonocardia sp. KRD291]
MSYLAQEQSSFGYGLPIREYLLVGLCAAVVTLLLTGPVRMLALKAGAVAWPRGRDVHVTPTPRWGGLAMFGGVLAGIGLAAQLPALRLAFFEGSTDVLGVLLATALLVGIGLLDDRYDLDAITKFAAQITAGGVLVLFGVQWLTFWIPWGGGGTGISGSYLLLGQAQGVLLTVLLTVALVNAMNFVDGLDGLAAGIGMITSLATAVFCIGLIRENGNDPATYSPALIAIVLAGACLGFLPHNFNPARIFMGDTGSMLVGVLLAAATTSASGTINFAVGANPTDFLALLTPLVVLAGIVFIPMLDLLLAVVRRTRAGTSPFSPDKMHLHHRLLEVGHSHRRAVLLAYLWVAVLAFGGVALALVDDVPLVLGAIAGGLVVAVVASAVPHRVRSRTAGGGTAGRPAP